MPTIPSIADVPSAKPTQLRLQEGALDAWLASASASKDEVGAMLLGTSDEVEASVLAVRPLENVSTTPRLRFEACALEFARQLREAEATGLRLLGFAHSHPRGEATPSREDLEASWPDCALLLAAPAAEHGAKLRAYWRHRDGLCEIPVHDARRGPG